MSLVSLEEAQSRAGDQITQDHINEVEEELASLIGPLVGSRTETFALYERTRPFSTVDGLYLSRRTNNVTVTNAALGESAASLTVGTDFRLLDNFLVERIPAGATWLSILAATYDPNDEETVRSIIFDWLVYRQTPVGLQSIRIGAYSETYFPEGSGSTKSTDPVVQGFLRRVLPLAGMGLTSPFRYSAHRRDRSLITGGSAS